MGASGAVGVWAVQLARHLGAEVTGVCSTRNLELVHALGAHHALDYTAGSLFRDGKTYDLIFDTAGVTSFADCRAALSDNGTYLPLESGLREMGQVLFTSLRGSKRVKLSVSKNTRQGLDQIVELIASGVLTPVVDRVYPIQAIADAHRHVESRHKRGSVVVAMGPAA